MLEKTEHMIMLKDFYGPLLTINQQELLSLYYEDDWSLSEIAENRGTSRQAVYDVLKRAEISLLEYEKRLGMLDKFMCTRQGLGELLILLEQAEFAGRERTDQASEIINRLMELL